MRRLALWTLMLGVTVALAGCMNRLPTAVDRTGGGSVAVSASPTRAPCRAPRVERVFCAPKPDCALDPCDPCAGGRCSVPR